MMRLHVVLVLLSLFAATAFAQPPRGAGRQPATTPPPLVNTLLPYVHDEGFAKDLGLSAEQVKKLVDYQKKQSDEAYKTAPAEYAQGAAERTKATTALFKEVLSPEQYKRAVGLAAGRLWTTGLRQFGGPNDFGPDGPVAIDTTRVAITTLASYPDAEIAKILQLSDEQKQLVTGNYNFVAPPSRPVVFLTPEQSKAAQEFLGKPASNRWSGQFIGGATNVGGDVFLFRNNQIPSLLSLTGARDVRTDAGITDEQNKELEAIRAKWQSFTADTRTLSPEARDKKRAEMTKETDEVLAKVLKPEQLTRLRQIERQTGGFGRNITGPLPRLSTRLRSANVRKELALTPDQEKTLTAAEKTLEDAILAAVMADGSFEDAVKAVTAAGEAREAAYVAALTDTQRKTLDGLFGKPFNGSTQDIQGGFGGGGDLRSLRVNNFGNHIVTELRVLAINEPIQKELALTAEQVKKAEKAVEEYLTKFVRGPGGPAVGGNEEELAKARAEQSDFIKKALSDTLTVDQAKRFRELMIQRAEGLGSLDTPVRTSVGAAGYPGVAEAIKLTDAQKTKLLDGDRASDVLTADQKTAIKTMTGKPYEGNFTVRPPTGGPGRPATTSATTAQVILNVPWDVFKIAPDQATKLVPVVNRYQLDTAPVAAPRDPNVVGGFGGPAPRVDPEKLAAANVTLTKALTETLKPEQLKRIEQVRQQLTSSRTTLLGSNPFLKPEVVKALELTPEQTTKIATVVGLGQRLRTAVQVVSSFGSSLAKVDEQVTARAMAVLTDEQKAKWKELIGDPVPNLPRLSPFGGGGPGF